MRNKIIRMKRLRAQRVLDDFMRMPARIITPSFDYREINAKALADSRLWVAPEVEVHVRGAAPTELFHQGGGA